VTGQLKKPQAKLYKSFLYLNGDEVINSLSALQGGDIDEVLTRSGEEGTGELGGEIGIASVKAKGGKKRSRKYEEEVRRKRTEHSAAALLLDKLHAEEAIGIVQGDYGPSVYQDLEEHMLLEFQAGVRIHPLHQTVTAARAWLKAAPGFGASKQDLAEMRETVQILEMLQAPDEKDRTFLVFAETADTDDDYQLVLPIAERHLLVPLDDFSGRATFIAQVDRILGDEDEVLAVRLLRDAPQLSIERDGLLDALPDLLGGMQELGIDVGEKDFILSSHTVLLKPICIYK
jgi:hypothetical protein